MDPFATSHISHDTLLQDLRTLDERDRKATALLLSRVAEVQKRRLFLREGYPSMHAYCIHGLHWCEGTASRRIYGGRTARRFPILFDAIADGRLHLTGVLMLAKHMTSGNVAELVAAATHKSKAEIQQLIAERFPQPDLPEMLQALAPPPIARGGDQHSPENAVAPPYSPNARDATAPTGSSVPGPERQHSPENAGAAVPTTCPPAAGPGRQHSPENAAWLTPRPQVTPLAPQRFGLQVTLDQETHDLLRRAQALTSHQVPAGEILPVLKGALRSYVEQLERQKYAATTRAGKARPCSSKRTIPAAVKRAVRERDGERCAFVSEDGRRCEARTLLEFDHQEPVARGGAATVENVRLVCRAHNQYAAECAFGAEFMERKRSEPRDRARA
jgi:hypothetical protein